MEPRRVMDAVSHGKDSPSAARGRGEVTEVVPSSGCRAGTALPGAVSSSVAAAETRRTGGSRRGKVEGGGRMTPAGLESALSERPLWVGWVCVPRVSQPRQFGGAPVPGVRSCSSDKCHELLTSTVSSRAKCKRHDIMELNSDVVNLISCATQERLRGLLEKLTVIARHRISTHKGSDKYIICSDTRAQLRFLEKLDHLEKQRKDEEEREMLLRAAKSRSNKEDPEQLRLKQKAKEMQQLELAQVQQREANLTALAAIGPRKKRPLDSSNVGSGLEGLNGTGIAGSTGFSLTKQILCPRVTRVCLRDLIFCMEQEREMKHSLHLYRALLK